MCRSIRRQRFGMLVVALGCALTVVASTTGCGLVRLPLDAGRRLLPQPQPGPGSRDKPQMKKVVTEGASFVLYAPDGWMAQESEQAGYRSVKVSGPSGLEVTMSVGRDFTGGDPLALGKKFVEAVQQEYPDMSVTEAGAAGSGDRITFEGAYTGADGAPMQYRAWASVKEGEFVVSTIAAPEGELDANKELLLTVLSNIDVMKGAITYSGPLPVTEPLVPYKLSDGSASFKMPQGWQVQEVGATCFVAYDDAGKSFSAGSADVITPELGWQDAPLPVSEYLRPSEALKFLGEQDGTITDVEFSEVNDYEELASRMEQTMPGGGVTVQDMTYTCKTREGTPSKGYTLGFSFYSKQMNTAWTFKHLTVIAPEDEFDAYAGAFAEMIASYTIDQGWVADYVARGNQRLQQMQQETSDLIARNSDDIREMTSAAYEERSASQDYLDYQWGSYIRGEQDWVSQSEGGTIYKSDSWGTQNTASGDYYEGQPYNYFNYGGENPNTGEQMTPIDTRELWEQNVR
ncbi:MAG: hypothetical protein HY876_10295 [Coriobacteriales bacterium]|nr:hypothetical protein [Coriobacteriales bacterium]